MLLGALVHLDTHPFRSTAARLANLALAEVLHGRIHVEAVHELSLSRVRLQGAQLFDESGDRVLQLQDVTVLLPERAALLRLLWTPGHVKLRFPHARAESAWVAVLDDRTHGGVTLERALTPRPRPPRAARPEREPSEVRVSFEQLELGRVRGHFSSPALAQLSPRLYRVRGTLSFEPGGVNATVERFGARAQGPHGAPIRGTGSFSLRTPGPMRAEFSGFYKKTEVQAQAQLEAGRLHAELRVPQVTPEAGRSLWAAWPLTEPAALSAQLEGSLYELSFRGKGSARAGQSELTLDGTWNARGAPLIDAAAQLHAFDLRLLLPDAPPSELNARAQFTLHQTDETLSATLTGATEQTELAGVPIPPLRFAVNGWPPTVNATLEVLDPDAPVRAGVTTTDAKISGQASVRDLNLARQRWTPRGVRGLSSLQARFQLQQGQASVDLHADVRALSVSDARVEALSFDVTGFAPWSELLRSNFRLQASASGLHWGAVRFDSARFDGHISQAGLKGRVDLSDRDGRRVRVSGAATLQGQLRSLDLHAQRGELTLEAQIPRLNLEGPEVHVASLKLVAPDMKLSGSGQYRPGYLQAKIFARDLQLHRVGRPLGWSPGTVTGRANVDLDVTLAPDLQRGHMDVGLDGVSFGGWGRTQAHLQADLRGDAVTGQLSLSNDLGVGLDGQWDLRLAGAPLDVTSWRDAAGSSKLFIHGVDLMALGLLVSSESVSELQGMLGARLSLHRPAGGRLPNGLFEIGVSGLQARLPAVNPDGITGPLTLYLTGAFDAPSGVLHATSIVEDAHGRLATVRGRAQPDFELLLEDPLRALHQLVHDPMRLSLHVPRRPISQLPWLSRQAMEGQIEAKLDLDGSLVKPELRLWLSATALRAPTLRRDAALDAALQAHYAPVSGQLELELGANMQGRRVAQGRLAASLPWGASPWQHLQTLEGRVEFYELQLATLAPIAKLDLAGTLSGRLEMLPARQTLSPMLAAMLTLEDFSSGRARLGSGTLRLEGEPGTMSSQLRLSQGLREVNVHLGITGPSSTLPFPVRVDDFEVRVEAARLDAAALAPLLGSTVSRLSGRIDGQLSLYLKRIGDSGGWRSSISGDAQVTQGGAYVGPLGLELRDIRLRATAIPRGDATILEVNDVTAKARSQRTNLEGHASFLLHGVRLSTGNAQLLLRSVPLTLQGRSLGTASGRLTAQLERRDEGWDEPGPYASGPYLLVNAVLENWRLKAAASASRPLIELDPKAGVVVLQQEPTAADDDLLPYRFIVELGRDVQVSVAEMELPVGGQLNIAYAGDTTLNGSLQLKRGGRLPLLGRVFQVVDGSVLLNPRTPSNPNLDVTLEGRSADGSPVFVTISGTLEEPVTDPPAAQLRELLGGGTATVLSGGVQALGLGQLLGDRVQLRIGTSDEHEETPTYSAAFQIDDNLWFEANYQNLTEATMTQQDGSALSGTVEYRFRHNWSLRTQIGTAGGSLDLLWQYRY